LTWAAGSVIDRIVDPRPHLDASRRAFLRGGAFGLLALALGPRLALAAASQARRLRAVSIHTAERVDLVFHDGRGYDPDALTVLERFLRDPFTGEAHPIDPAVLDIAWSVARAAGREATPFDVVCGYRSPATNARLHARSPRGVDANSLHLTGRAIDLRLPGLPLARLREVAHRLQVGGVGFYPQDDFVHLDSGRPRSW
jgi:uncharacterized protein YcbK (DUF882 family)